MLCYLALELAVLGLAFFYAVRARHIAVIAALSVLVYSTAALGLATIPPHVRLPGAGVLEQHWAIYPVVCIVLAAAATWISFRRSAGEWEGTDRHRLTERTALACLGLTLLHVAALVVLGVAHLAVARDSF